VATEGSTKTAVLKDSAIEMMARH